MKFDDATVERMRALALHYAHGKADWRYLEDDCVQFGKRVLASLQPEDLVRALAGTKDAKVFSLDEMIRAKREGLIRAADICHTYGDDPVSVSVAEAAIRAEAAKLG